MVARPEDLFPNRYQNPSPNQPGFDYSVASAPPAPTTEINEGPATTDVPVPDTSQPQSDPLIPTPAFDSGADLFQGLAENAPAVTAEQTVQGQLDNLLSEGSPVLDYARGSAQRFANSRGLLNSSIAAEAGEHAVLAQAVPIASQDANTYAARAQQEAGAYQAAGLAAQQGLIQSHLMAQDHLQSLAQASHQGNINSRLQLEQYGYNFQLNEQQNLHNMELAALQGDIQGELALQAFGYDLQLMRNDHAFRLTLTDRELRNSLQLSRQDDEQLRGRMQLQHELTLREIDARDDVAGEEFTRNLQQNYLTAVERRTLQFSSEVTAIYQTQGLTAEQQRHAVSVSRHNLQQDILLLQDYYRRSPGWDPAWGANQFVGPQFDPANPPVRPPATEPSRSPPITPRGGPSVQTGFENQR